MTDRKDNAIEARYSREHYGHYRDFVKMLTLLSGAIIPVVLYVMADVKQIDKEVVLFNYGMVLGLRALLPEISNFALAQDTRREIEQLTRKIEELPITMVATAAETGILPEVAFLDGYKTGHELFLE